MMPKTSGEFKTLVVRFWLKRAKSPNPTDNKKICSALSDKKSLKTNFQALESNTGIMESSSGSDYDFLLK